MKYKDYYEVLGVPRTATADEIKKSYRKLAHKYHPDVSKVKGAEDKFKELQEAYSTLKDSEKRSAYDQLGQRPSGEDFAPPPNWGANAGASSFSFDDMDLSDLFAAMGRGRTGQQSQHAERGEDFHASTTLTIEQVHSGIDIELQMTRQETSASGQVRAVPSRVKVRIPKGATEGEELRLRGRGGPGLNGGPAGDIYLTIHIHPHPLYKVDGHDLVIDLPISPAEAALGTTVEIPTLTGPVELNIPPGIQSGKKLRLASKGLARPSGDAGALYAIVRIVVPTHLSGDEKRLYEQLKTASTASLRDHFNRS